MNEPTQVLNVADVFDGTSYVVPIYQRAYAWREEEILQLLRDLKDARVRKGAESNRSGNYYIGSLVVHRADGLDDQALEVVDGQQRLTTLALILSHPLAREVIHGRSRVADTRPAAHSVTFEGRPNSQLDLAEISAHAEDVYSNPPSREPRDQGLRMGVAVIARAFDGHSGANSHTAEVSLTKTDVEYLLDHVYVVRTDLPPGTDLNHYFEIMNSRGEQLEKHEIVKSHLLSHDSLTPRDRGVITTVWDAVSDLSRYVQQGFTTGQRSDLFASQWDALNFSSTSELFEILGRTVNSTPNDSQSTLGDVLSGPAVGSEQIVEEEAGRYGAIIDFPNFLLQALKIYKFTLARESGQDVRFSWSDPDGTVPLDDKRLIHLFKQHITTAHGARGFIRTLLIVRFLFDNYVIKTDQVHDSTDDDSNWVLRRPHRTTGGNKPKLSPRNTFSATGDKPTDEDQESAGVQRQILLLESMFQVTDSRRAYKNFLFATLDLLWQQHARGDVDAKSLISGLEELAKRRAAHLLGQNSEQGQVLDAGTSVPQFLFNYLDYQLWRHVTLGGEQVDGLSQDDSAASSFQFRYRKSIEHFYPVSPMAHHRESGPPKDVLDRFGNLCVMSVSENSRRNNLVALAKAAEFRSESESLKFQIMASITKAEHAWGTEQITAHGKTMMNLLYDSI